ncbi:DUF6364 family protein [uncultured Chryseobacterium sp.]|uniref:DUF6364 family protein n=1 Tax=uncultured Chryseobacterium sp. TaxID=259322 RepID=UPI0025CC672A|nr:DUF6364 family protein [uncultured Chryseobacterium sp.]
MNTKLTLTIEQSVIEKAKKYARKKERSLSDLIENYLKAITAEQHHHQKQLSPTLTSLKGSFKDTEDFDYKKELSDHLTQKYL